MALSHAIMTALIEANLSGYELARSFDTSLGFFWHASHQQIYRELKKLSEQSLVVAHNVPQAGKPDKILYSLTERGVQTLAEWFYEKSRLYANKDDLLVKLYNLKPENVGHMIGAITQRRQWLASQLKLYEKIRQLHFQQPDSLSLRKQGVYLVLRSGIAANEQHIDWCDEALQRLQPLATAPSASHD